MACISHQHKYEVPVVLVPSEVLVAELLPDGFALFPPLLGVGPVDGVEVVQNPGGVDDEVVLSVVEHDLDSPVEQVLQLPLVGGGEVVVEIVVHLLVVVDVVEPIGHPETLFLGLEVVFVVGVYISSVVLSEIEHIHAQVVFACHVVVGYDEVDVACGFVEIPVLYLHDGLILHEGGGVPPVVGDCSHRVEVAVVEAGLEDGVDPAVADQHSLQIDAQLFALLLDGYLWLVSSSAMAGM